MSDSAQPSSRTPTLAEVLRSAVEYHLQDLFTAMPGIVDKYSALKQRADIQPAIMRRQESSDGGEILESLPVLPNVPILWPRAGGFFMHMPLAKGNPVLLIFSQRSIDKYVNGDSAEETDPDDFLLHDISSAIAIPGVYPFADDLEPIEVDPNALVMGKQGGCYVQVKEDIVSLGKTDADEFLARADRTLDSIQGVADSLDTLVSTYNGHGHSVPGVFAGPFTATASPTTSSGTPHGAADDVASDKVKGE